MKHTKVNKAIRGACTSSPNVRQKYLCESENYYYNLEAARLLLLSHPSKKDILECIYHLGICGAMIEERNEALQNQKDKSSGKEVTESNHTNP